MLHIALDAQHKAASYAVQCLAGGVADASTDVRCRHILTRADADEYLSALQTLIAAIRQQLPLLPPDESPNPAAYELAAQ